MAFLDNTGLGTVWGKIKDTFVAGFGTSVSDSSSYTIKLKNKKDVVIDTLALPLADSTNSKAGLMSPTEKSKLAGIASGAEVNVQSDWSQSTTTADDYIKNKPTKVSDFTNDSGFITTADLPSPTSTTPNMDGTAAVGTETTFARGDHVHPTDTSRAASSHTHGYISNAGEISVNAGAVSDGDQLLVAHGNNQKVQAVTIAFDGTDSTKALTKKGTWETFSKATPPSASTSNPLMDGTASAGSSTAYSRGDHVHPSDTTKVDKVTGKGLSTNDYTTADKTKVGYVDTGKNVTTYVSEQISTAMTGAAKYKGTVGTGGTVTTLPTTGYKQGDYYVVCAAGTYAGHTCEVGDMLFANKDYASGATASADWDAVQANITAMTTEEINAICV